MNAVKESNKVTGLSKFDIINLDDTEEIKDSKVPLIMESLQDYYMKNDNLKKLKAIQEQRGEVSLRVLDWFVTNYTKKHRIRIKHNSDLINVHENYKLQLRSYSKKQFDPFCRKSKKMIEFGDSNDDYINTSCGQLCFFRWAFENGIIDYVQKHLKSIEDDMKENEKRNKKSQDLTPKVKTKITKKKVNYTVEFGK